MSRKAIVRSVTIVIIIAVGLCPRAEAITITQGWQVALPTTPEDVTADVQSVLGGDLTIDSALLLGHSLPEPDPAYSAGTYSNPDGVYGIGPGVILSTGNVLDYGSGLNVSPMTSTDYSFPGSAEQESLLLPIVEETGTPQFPLFDVTQLTLFFTAPAGRDRLVFDMAFGTEEYPETIDVVGLFNDGFGAYLSDLSDGPTVDNVAIVGGMPVNASHPWMREIPGTELDGVIVDPTTGLAVQRIRTPIIPGRQYALTLIIGDYANPDYDSTVYVASLDTEASQYIPEPVTLVGFAAGAALLGGYVRKRRAA